MPRRFQMTEKLLFFIGSMGFISNSILNKNVFLFISFPFQKPDPKQLFQFPACEGQSSTDLTISVGSVFCILLGVFN